MDYRRLFLNWLEGQGIRKNFLHNCRTVESFYPLRVRYDNHPITYVWKLAPRNYILESFDWGSTSEQENFWYNYHQQWREYLNDYQSTH